MPIRKQILMPLSRFGVAIFISIFIGSGVAMAIPTLQVYIPDSTAGSWGEDEDSWIAIVLPGTFDLYAVAAYGPKDENITQGTLLITVPQGQSGTISFSTIDEMPTLLTVSPETLVKVDADKLTHITGLDGYTTTDFLPSTIPVLNHYPLNKPHQYDFIIFNLGNFTKEEAGLYDYNAETGAITYHPSAQGEQKEYTVTISGFEYVHFDMYAYVETVCTCRGGGNCKCKKWRTTWEGNPGSHDSTAVTPEPATLVLLGSGLAGIGWFGKRLKGRSIILLTNDDKIG